MNFYVANHVGLGDHILCNGIYRHFASIAETVYVPCRRIYYHSIRRMLHDLPNVRVVPYSDLFVAPMIVAHRKFLLTKGFHSIDLGIFGDDFYGSKGVRYDEKFYDQAGIPFEFRWSKFSFPRNKFLENKLFERIVGANKDYVFIHEDKSRGFTLDRNLLPKNCVIVEPIQLGGYINFFDYTKILESAREIHCIESSFAALIESLGLAVPKFAHRYARPEAATSFFHEFTYRSDWSIHH